MLTESTLSVFYDGYVLIITAVFISLQINIFSLHCLPSDVSYGVDHASSFALNLPPS